MLIVPSVALLQVGDRGVEGPAREFVTGDADPLVAEGVFDDRDGLTFLAQHGRSRDDDILEEHLVQVALADEARDRAHGDPREFHVDEEDADALPSPAARPREQEAVVGQSGVRRPDFRAVDHEGIAVPFGDGAQRKKIGSRGWL
jgi:hypothetical protein